MKVVIIGSSLLVVLMLYFALTPWGPQTPEEYRAWHRAQQEAHAVADAKAAEAKRLRPQGKEEVLKLLYLKTSSRIFRTLLKVDLAVTNASDTRVKDLVVSCRQFAPSGTYLGTIRHTLYEQIPPRSYDWTLSFPGIFLGRVHPSTAEVSCAIEDMTMMAHEPRATATAAR